MAEFDFQVQRDLVTFLVTWLLASVFIHSAARIVLDRSSFGAALLTALVATLLATLVLVLTGGGVLGFVLAVLVWAVVCAAFYRTSWLKGAVVGLVAWVLFVIVAWLVRRLLD